MTFAWAAAAVLGAMAGIITTPALTVHGLAQFGRGRALPRSTKMLSAVAGCGAGAVAIVAAHEAGTWWVVPALLVWACTLVAAAACDAVTQRIPTALVRRGGAGTVALLIMGLAVHRDWRGLIFSAAAAAAAGSALLLFWRFAGVGFGDVRLAALGGLGLGHATYRGAIVGLFAFCVVTLIQAGVTILRGANRRTTIPFGPALATGLLVAASF